MKEITLALIKPDAIKDKNAGSILFEMERHFEIGDIYGGIWSGAFVKEFYVEHQGKEFFPDLVSFMVSEKIIAVTLVGDDAVGRWRRMMGATDPKKAEPDTIRGRFGSKTGPLMWNAVHGSDSERSATREIDLVRFGLVRTDGVRLTRFGDVAVRLVKAG